MEQNGSELSGSDTNNPLLKHFLLNYEAKRWSKAKFFISMKSQSSGGADDIIGSPQAVKISEI
jgi:hypothetical protein